MQRDVPCRRAAAVQCLAAFSVVLASCAAAGVHNAAADGRFDGTYVGTRSQDASCGNERHSITFHVLDGGVSVHSRHKRRRLAGTVSPDGQLALSDPTGGRQISGSVSGVRLEAIEQITPSEGSKHRKSGLDDPTATPCLWRYEAIRTADQAAPDDAE